MGLSRLLHPPITTTTSFLFRTIGVARQTRHRLSSSSSPGNKLQAAKARKSEAVETYVKMYVEKNPGSFPKVSYVQKEIGGSWYTLKELLHNAKEKIFGNSKLQSDSINDVTSTSAADATASTVVTTQEKGSEKSDYNEVSNTLADTPGHESNNSPNSTPGTSGEILSDMTGDTALDAKTICKDLENTGPCKPRNLIQSSADMKSENNCVIQAISNVKPEHCSEVPLNVTASEGVCDSPYARIPEAASDFSVGTAKVEGILNSPNPSQQKTKRTQLKEQQNALDKPEKLSSLIYEATKTWQVKVEDKMASTGCRNQLENKLFVDRSDKKIEEPPAAKPENKHLELEEKPSTELVSSNAETSTTTMQINVPTTFESIRNDLKQTRNTQKVSTVAVDKVSKEDGMPASGIGAQKFTRLSALFSEVDNQKAGQVMDKYNILESNGYLENSDKNSRGNVPKPSGVNDLIDCIKGYPLGQQVTSGPGIVISKKSDQNRLRDHLRVLFQVNMQKLDDEGRQTSSSHIFSQKSEKPSEEAPVKIAYKNGKTDNQEIGNAESVALNANIPPMWIDRTCKESLDQYKVIVKFVHKDAGEQDLFTVLKQFDKILKIEFSAAGKNRYKTATVYFKTWAGMQNALQTTDLILRGWVITLEAASSLGQSKNITIPSLIGDPDAPAALIKNPTRTVAIKQLIPKICPRHIEEALAFCESNISGFFLGSSDSVAYVEFETEDGKDRALAEQSLMVLGKRLFIYRVDTPRTTIVRIRTMFPGILWKHSSIFKTFGNIRAFHQRSSTIWDVHFSIIEWPNMLQILNKINGMQVDGVKLIAEPAPIVPSDVLLQIYSQPEERKRVKSNMLGLLQKLEENGKTKITDKFSKLYDVRCDRLYKDQYGKGWSFMELASGKKKGCNKLFISGLYTEVPWDVVVQELGFGSYLHTKYTTNLLIMLLLIKGLKPPKNANWFDREISNFDPGGGTIVAGSAVVPSLYIDTFGMWQLNWSTGVYIKELLEGSTLHLIGLLSDDGVHTQIGQVWWLAFTAVSAIVPKLCADSFGIVVLLLHLAQLSTTPASHGLQTAREILTILILKNITKNERAFSEHTQLAQSFGDTMFLFGINRREKLQDKVVTVEMQMSLLYARVRIEIATWKKVEGITPTLRTRSLLGGGVML